MPIELAERRQQRDEHNDRCERGHVALDEFGRARKQVGAVGNARRRTLISVVVHITMSRTSADNVSAILCSIGWLVVRWRVVEQREHAAVMPRASGGIVWNSPHPGHSRNCAGIIPLPADGVHHRPAGPAVTMDATPSAS